MGKSSPSSPPSPDYAGAAREQGAANKEAAYTSSLLNNPNVYSPEGSQMWSDFGPDARPTLTQQFSPARQALYDQGQRTSGLLGTLAESGATQLGQVIGQNADFSGAPSAPGSAETTRNTVYDAIMSRVNKNLDLKRDQTRSDLVAAGIPIGSDAYNRQQELINQEGTDASQQAILASGQEAQRDFGMDTQRRKDAIAEYLSQRQTPLGEAGYLLGLGQGPANPYATPGVSQNTNIAPAPIFGAAQAQYGAASDRYNAEMESRNATTQGLFALASAGLGAATNLPWAQWTK